MANCWRRQVMAELALVINSPAHHLQIGKMQRDPMRVLLNISWFNRETQFIIAIFDYSLLWKFKRVRVF